MPIFVNTLEYQKTNIEEDIALLNKMKTKLDIDYWVRKEHYLFFKEFEEPFYGVCVNIDCTHAYRKAKEMGTSFFTYYLHKSLTAVNAIENFRYRIENDDVYLYDIIDATITVARPNGTFGFSTNIAYVADYKTFEDLVAKETERVKNASVALVGCTENVIHYSAVPYINFTSISHARKLSRQDSSPKISFGKLTQKDGTYTMPVSVHVHHALVDGLHVGQHIDEFQRLMNE